MAFQVGDFVEYLGGYQNWDSGRYPLAPVIPVGTQFRIGSITNETTGNWIFPAFEIPRLKLHTWNHAPEICFRKVDHTASVTISGGCSCGGRLDTHKKECPEAKDAKFNNSYTKKNSKVFDEDVYNGLYYPRETKKCECGAESIGATSHSEWCAKHDKN